MKIKLSGFTILRNIIKYDYPVKESILSILPLVDEMVIALGDSDDGTEELVKSIDSPLAHKIKIVHHTWDNSLNRGGLILSEATNFALSQISGEWGFYLQADEVLHEKEYASILSDIDTAARKGYQAVRFKYFHFKGDYQTTNPWAYHREIRVIKNGTGIRSVGDGCSFHIGKGNRSPRYYNSNCHIYHYGWVKSPTTMLEKYRNFETYYHGKDWVEKKYKETQADELFKEVKICRVYRGDHPQVMQKRIAAFPPIPRPRSRWLYLELYKKFFKYGWV